MNKPNVIGWVILLVGTAVWVYGYLFATGNSSLIDWHAHTPWWVADFLPNFESEIGMALVFASVIPLYWPSQRGQISGVEPDEVVAVIPAGDVATAIKKDDRQPAGQSVMDAVREMIWKEPDVRRTYEALRARGLSADDVVTEIAKAYVGCQWESRGRVPGLWPDVLREMREGRFSFRNAGVFGHFIQNQQEANAPENTDQIVRSKQTLADK